MHHSLVSRIPRWAPTALLAVAGVGALSVVSRIDPNAQGSLLPECPFHALTGLYCPGCGSTRCLHALTQLDVLQALTMNPLLTLALPFIALMALNAAGVRLRPLDPLIRVLAKPQLWLVLLLGFAVLRNLPWMPFTLLAPG
ncbi:hypothetical protein CSC70_03720 [Pseudoxanthomonas kalamensis DSM 18571]|uniref:DUF2752 domain-containing protein n=1 Tax=Pseudoxanthomonas kalamensis TaxID=289483 RepID=UPI0013914608|nr:DUF2752 domain-containing protein [Pseudoxanthomonas kalamensis]KAF1712619.1 hypothetical protein CSC70_03720 [Pseudoxanthomonas kalamensis DSM 18571]